MRWFDSKLNYIIFRDLDLKIHECPVDGHGVDGHSGSRHVGAKLMKMSRVFTRQQEVLIRSIKTPRAVLDLKIVCCYYLWISKYNSGKKWTIF